MNDKKRHTKVAQSVLTASHHGQYRSEEHVIATNFERLFITSLDADHFSQADWQKQLRKYRNQLAHVRPLNRYTRVKYLVRLEKERGGNPPALAEFFLGALLAKRTAEAFLGDLEERFTFDCKTVGVRRARLRYWAATARSVLPIVWRSLRKIGVTALAVGAFKALFPK